MAGFRGYQDLAVWRKSLELVVTCYEIAKGFPASEKFGLCSQLQRAAVSVPANIAEGHGRGSTKEFLHFLHIAYGSLMELETHLQIGFQLQYLTSDQLENLLLQSGEIGRMLNGLKSSLQRRLPST